MRLPGLTPWKSLFQSRGFIAAAIVGWVCLTLVGFVGLTNYSLRAGQRGEPPSHWPASTLVRPDPHLPTLVMAIHPHCPCSRASVAELENVMTRCQGHLAARVLFVQPPGVGDSWTQTDMWRSVARIPGVMAIVDRDEVATRGFGAFTSGQTALYDKGGRLVFSGGITGARGHAGSNRGENELLDAVSANIQGVATAPVYGCPLEDFHGTLQATRKGASCPNR